MRRFFGVLVALLIVQALPPFAGTALAHARPVRYDPAPGVVLSTAPTQLSGWFSSEMRRVPDTFLHVLDANGQRVDTGDAQLSSDRKQMTVALRSGLGPGRYLVNWSANDDADGHTLAGCYVFFIGEAAAAQAQSAGDPLDGGSRCPAPAEHEDEGPTSSVDADGDDSGGIPVWVLAAGVIGGIVVGSVGGRVLGKS